MIIFVVIGWKKNIEANKTDLRVTNFEKIIIGAHNNFTISHDFNFDEAYEKGISPSKDRVTEQYLDLQNKYNIVLGMYLKRQIPCISDFDKNLGGLYIKKVPKLKLTEVASVKNNPVESYYQSLSSLDSNYIYLSSNIYVERLSKDDIKLLKDNSLDNPKGRKILIEMVSRTYVNVTSADSSRLDSIWSESKGTTTVTVPKTALVFWVTYKEYYNDKGNYIDESKSTAASREADLLAQKYSIIFSQELGHEVRIFVHNCDYQ